jgi:hypothetical protein
MRKVIAVFVAIISVLAFGTGSASASNAGELSTYRSAPAATSTKYTARYTSAEYAYIVKAANFYHLNHKDVPKTGVKVLAFILKIAPHPNQKPMAKPANNGKTTMTTTYDTPSMKADMASVSHYLALNGHDTLYVGGLVMGYLAALGEARAAGGGGGGGGGGNCTPGYSPCLPPASDYDCEGGSGNGPAYTGPVRVTGNDIYDLDRDGDGYGCE